MYGPVTGLITYVDIVSDFHRDTDREVSGASNGEEKGTGPIGLLSGMGGSIIGGYLDSGANAHIFKMYFKKLIQEIQIFLLHVKMIVVKIKILRQ